MADVLLLGRFLGFSLDTVWFRAALAGHLTARLPLHFTDFLQTSYLFASSTSCIFTHSSSHNLNSFTSNFNFPSLPAPAVRCTAWFSCGLTAIVLGLGIHTYMYIYREIILECACLLSCQVLCSLQNPSEALSEVLRVLKPGGKLLLIEHVISPSFGWLQVSSCVRRKSWQLFSPQRACLFWSACATSTRLLPGLLLVLLVKRIRTGLGSSGQHFCLS